jgi:hypothetical protein
MLKNKENKQKTGHQLDLYFLQFHLIIYCFYLPSLDPGSSPSGKHLFCLSYLSFLYAITIRYFFFHQEKSKN